MGIVRQQGLLRAGMMALGSGQLLVGLWAVLDSGGWFNTFPGFGDAVLGAYGPYNSHLATDAGAGFVAIGSMLLLASVWFERRVVQAALIAYLLYDIPHTAYHLANDDQLATATEQILNSAVLVGTVVVAAGLLALTRQTTPAPARRHPSDTADAAARIATKRSGLFARAGNWYTKRSYGGEVTPSGVFAHHPKLALGYASLELATVHSHRVDDKLKALAEIKTSAMVNCEWCIDFGSFLAHELGIPDEQISEMPRHSESPAFNELERLVIDYAVAMTRTPAEVGDDLFARLREHFDDAQLVELTSVIAIENYRARFNHATGMTAQGFSEGLVCIVPEPAPLEASASGGSGRLTT